MNTSPAQLDAVIIGGDVPDEYLGSVLKLCEDRRGRQVELTYAGSRAMVVYELPLNEVVFDFCDRLKSISKGYASFDYELDGYGENALVKLEIRVNEEPVDALAMICHRDNAESRGRQMCERLKDLIPRQMFKIAIQACLGGKIIAAEHVSALRKDVTAKCYGGDITRKRKLLERQKEGKRRMKMVGQVEVPQEAFISVLQVEQDIIKVMATAHPGIERLDMKYSRVVFCFLEKTRLIPKTALAQPVIST